MVTFCAANHPARGLQAIDVAHNIGAVANPFISALRTLQKNLDADLHATFTQAKNCPTPNVRAPDSTCMQLLLPCTGRIKPVAAVEGQRMCCAGATGSSGGHHV